MDQFNMHSYEDSRAPILPVIQLPARRKRIADEQAEGNTTKKSRADEELNQFTVQPTSGPLNSATATFDPSTGIIRSNDVVLPISRPHMGGETSINNNNFYTSPRMICPPNYMVPNPGFANFMGAMNYAPFPMNQMNCAEFSPAYTGTMGYANMGMPFMFPQSSANPMMQMYGPNGFGMMPDYRFPYFPPMVSTEAPQFAMPFYGSSMCPANTNRVGCCAHVNGSVAPPSSYVDAYALDPSPFSEKSSSMASGQAAASSVGNLSTEFGMQEFISPRPVLQNQAYFDSYSTQVANHGGVNPIFCEPHGFGPAPIGSSSSVNTTVISNHIPSYEEL